MTHLEIIKEAYDKCGIKYIVRESRSDYDDILYSYLFLVGDISQERREYFERNDLDRLLALEDFMEFENGKIASF